MNLFYYPAIIPADCHTFGANEFCDEKENACVVDGLNGLVAVGCFMFCSIY